MLPREPEFCIQFPRLQTDLIGVCSENSWARVPVLLPQARIKSGSHPVRIQAPVTEGQLNGTQWSYASSPG